MTADDLKQISLFRDLSDALLQRLSHVVEEQELADEATIFSEGDAGNAVYFIATGAVRIEKRIEAGGTKSKTLAILGAGDFFGEMSLFDGKPRSAATVALGSTKVYRLGRDAFEALMQSDSAVGAGLLFAIINTCNERIRSLNAKVIVYHEVGKAIGADGNLQSLLDIVLKQLVGATNAQSGALLLKQEFSERLEVRCQAGLSLTAEELDNVMEGVGVLAGVIAAREVLLIEDSASMESMRDLPRCGLERKSMILQPIVAGDVLLGVIVLGHSEPGHFDLDGTNLCAGVASQAGQAILNFRHREEESARSRLGRKFVQF